MKYNAYLWSVHINFCVDKRREVINIQPQIWKQAIVK